MAIEQRNLEIITLLDKQGEDWVAASGGIIKSYARFDNFEKNLLLLPSMYFILTVTEIQNEGVIPLEGGGRQYKFSNYADLSVRILNDFANALKNRNQLYIASDYIKRKILEAQISPVYAGMTNYELLSFTSEQLIEDMTISLLRKTVLVGIELRAKIHYFDFVKIGGA